MNTRTIFLGRLIGLFLIIFSLPMFWQKQLIVETYDATIHQRPVIFLLGMILLACGLAMVLLHNVWSGGALPIVVTVLGWLTLLKGVLILYLTPEALIDLFGVGRVGSLLYLYAVIYLVLGLFLTIASFTITRPHLPAGRVAGSL
jgi:hypothetical protein